MDISAGLIGKIAAGGTAAAATTTAGLIYGEDIFELFVGSKDTLEKNSLGLPPAFSWPTNSSTPTKIILAKEQLKKVNFDGKTETELTVSENGSVTLDVKKNSGNDNDLNNYVFIFKNENDSAITLGNNSDTPLFILRKDMNLEFKIKNVNSKWSLEKVWNKEHIAEKIGLECDSNDECTLKGEKSIVIKQGSNKSNEISTLTITGESKIKLHKDSKGYDQGLRFNIEGGDIDLSNAGNSITKLEKNESYEIKQEDGKWILSRKNSALDGLNEKLKRLGLPNDCKFLSSETSKECNDLNSTAFKKIKFSGGNVSNLTSTSKNFKLKIEKDTANTDVFSIENLRFTFVDFPVDVTLPQSIILKKGTSPEFKIKERESNWTLERAWDINKLAGKVGLNCNKSDKKCSLKSGQKISVFKDDANYVTGADINDKNSKKITYEEGVENYNQGFRFTVENNIDLNESVAGADKKGDVGKIEKGNGGNAIAYEIKEQAVNGVRKWFLSKVTTTPAA